MDLGIGTTIIRTMIGNPLLGTIGIQMTLTCLQTLSNVTSEIYGFITTIKATTYHVNIGTLLMELDLASEILFLESLLKEIDVEKNHTQTLAISLRLLQDCLTDIHTLLGEVNKRIEYNTKLWVNGFGLREHKFDDLSGKMRFLANNLEKRKENLIYAIKIKDELIPAPNVQAFIKEENDDLLDVSVISIDRIVTYEKNTNKKMIEKDKPKK